MAIGQRYTDIVEAAAEVFARRGYHAATTREMLENLRRKLG